jgi:site-specific DNA-cytosine methylase
LSDWFTEGFEAAEAAASQSSRGGRNHNFWTKDGEAAVVRFLSSSKDTFNIKRAFIKEAKGQKYFTSPMSQPDPFIQAGYPLQNTFIWKILDRRVLTFTDRANNEQTIQPRVLYFAMGQRDRKALQAFEAQMLADYNEELVEAGKQPVTDADYNITKFDMKVSKPKGQPWMFHPVRRGKPTALDAADLQIIEDTDFDLAEELKPLPMEQILQVIGQQVSPVSSTSDTGSTYSYDPDEVEEQPTFFGK